MSALETLELIARVSNAEAAYDCHGGPGTTQDACGACITCLKREADGLHDLIARQSQLLTAAVNALKGPPPPLTLWSHHDVAELAAAAVRGSLPPMSELITWHEVAVELPAEDVTVLGFNAAWDNRCWGCYHDDDTWRTVEGDKLTAKAKHPELLAPTHWAKWPFGPEERGGAR